MLTKLLPFELNLQLRQVGFWVTLALVFLGAAVLASISLQTGSERIKFNGATTTATLISDYSLLSFFFGAIFVVSGVMRDEVSKSLELIHAMPVKTAPMVIARYIGAYAATFLCLLAMVAGLFITQFAPWADKDALGPTNLLYYLQPTLIFVAVNALLVTAVFCTIAMVTRNRTLVYVSSIGLFILYTISSSLISDNVPDLLRALLDPFGAQALAIEARYLSPAEQNTQLAPIAGYVGINRLFWGGIAIGLFAFCFLRFKRGIGGGNKAKRGLSAHAAGTSDESLALYALKSKLSNNGFRTLLTRVKFEYLTTIRSVPFLILSALLLFFVILMLFFRDQLQDEIILPTSDQMFTAVFAGATLPLLLISIFFSGEIIWRDRVAKMTELIDVTRTQNWPLMAGKWLAMALIVLTIITGGTIIAITAQIVLGDTVVSFATHLGNSYMTFAPFIIFSCTLIMFIQNFMPNRVVGMITGGVVLGAVLFGINRLPFYHPMMNFGVVPTGGFSEMNGFADLTRFVWFLIYWSGLVGIFAVASIWLWRRGVQVSLLNRLKSLKSQITIGTSLLAATSAFAFVGAGATLYNGYSENDYQTRTERIASTVQLEKELGGELDTLLPKIRDVAIDVQFFPANRSVRASGSYRIENVTDNPLSQLYISGPMGERTTVHALSLEGASWNAETEEEKRHAKQGVRLYKFATPLPVGAETTLVFDLEQPTPTLGGNQLIINNGTFVNNLQIAPRLGIPDIRLPNPDERRRNDLPAFKEAPERTDEDARTSNFFSPDADYVNFKATVCTAPGQTPIAPGRTVKIYEDNGRPCRDYVPIEPIAFFFSFVSADYASVEDNWTAADGSKVDLAIYYDSQHDYNVALMIQAMKDSLDTFTDVYGPYQYDNLRIMEFPYLPFAQSFAGTIPFSENIGFVIDPGDADDTNAIDLATYVTMHEIGHQWFGHQIVPARTEGYNILSEGLTENAAMTAYERTFGWQKARRMLERRGITSYLTGRALDRGAEQPLATAEGGQQYLTYAKSSWTFWGLKHYIGEDEMQGAIRAFLDDYGQQGPPYPTTLELVDYLREAAGPDYQQLVTDYFDRITFWSLNFAEDKLDVKERNGKFTVAFDLNLDKQVASGRTGRAVSVLEAEYEKLEKSDIGSTDEEAKEDSNDAPKGKLIRAAEDLDEWVEIGFYDKDPGETFGDEWIKLERVHITKPLTALSFELETEPSYVVLDPRRLLIERNAQDNELEINIDEDS